MQSASETSPTLKPILRLTSSQATSLPTYPEIDEEYQLLARIGEGVGGSVFLAEHRESRMKVAIKVLQRRASTFYKLKQVYREIAIHRRLSQTAEGRKFVPRFHKAIDGYRQKCHGPEAFIIMEYITGVTLSDYLDKCQKKEIFLSSARAKTLIFNILRALACIHSAGVIHRDVKPQNLMVDIDNLDVKIIDFGLARTLDQKYPERAPRSEEDKKRSGRLLTSEVKARKSQPRSMTPHVQTRLYRSPEICLLEKDYSQSADIWSFGCILAEILQCQEQYSLSSCDPSTRMMFLATASYPLSPDSNLMDKPNVLDRLTDQDLLKVILEFLGDLKPHDLSFLSKPSSAALVTSCFSGEGQVDFAQEFEGTPHELTEVLTYSLQFNPFFRLSAHELLQLPAFQDLEATSPSQASVTDSRINLRVDEPGAFNYETLESPSINAADLRQMISCETKR